MPHREEMIRKIMEKLIKRGEYNDLEPDMEQVRRELRREAEEIYENMLRHEQQQNQQHQQQQQNTRSYASEAVSHSLPHHLRGKGKKHINEELNEIMHIISNPKQLGGMPPKYGQPVPPPFPFALPAQPKKNNKRKRTENGGNKQSWPQFVKEYQKMKGCSFKEALSQAGPLYKKFQGEMKGGSILSSIGDWLWKNAVKPIGSAYLGSIFKR